MAELGMENTPRTERRRYSRANGRAATDQLPLTAVLFRRDAALGRFTVQNLSAGGALLTGRRDVAVDERVRVLLPLPGRAPLVVDGKIARRATAGSDLVVLAVQFRHRSPSSEDAIQEALVRELSRRAELETPSVLVVQDSAELSERLRSDLASLGRRVHVATTPLDAIRWLEDPVERVDVAFVDVSAGDVDGLGLMRFLHEEHPTVRRVLVQGAVRPSVADLMETSKVVHRVLAEPWDKTALTEALGG